MREYKIGDIILWRHAPVSSSDIETSSDGTMGTAILIKPAYAAALVTYIIDDETLAVSGLTENITPVNESINLKETAVQVIARTDVNGDVILYEMGTNKELKITASMAIALFITRPGLYQFSKYTTA